MSIARALAILALAAPVSIGLPWPIAPVQAACYETVGCTNEAQFSEEFLLRNAECQILWEMRNQIFKENGYCFRTERAIAAFGNTGCYITDQAGVALSPVERTNVATIQRVERRKGCSN